MPLTVAETVQELERLKHLRAVWMETVEFLSRCVDKESRKADHGIIAEGCVSSTVPQNIVQEFLDQINEEEIDPLNIEIGALENLFVEEANDGTEPEDQNKKAKPKTEKGTLKKRKSKGSSKTPGSSGRVRTISRPTGHKAQGTR
jgi:hypothetical protein